MKQITWIVLSWLVLLTTAQATSFDCAKASTKVENLICGEAELSKLDDELSKAYRQALDQGEDKQKVIKEQRQWLKESRNSCDASNCLKSVYQNRISELGRKPKIVFRDCADCPEMVAIPAGSFELSLTNTVAVHEVVSTIRTELKSFAMGKTEVTQAQWRAIMGGPKLTSKQFSTILGKPRDASTRCGDNCPVAFVSYEDAKEFIDKLNAKTGKQYRLPSDVEWEYACRAGRNQKYCGSDSADDVAWYGANSGMADHEVAKKKPNAFGLYDMSGNVWEWTEGCISEKYYGGCGGPDSRVNRGGGWNSDESTVQAITGNPEWGPSYGAPQQGFRVARTLP